MVNVQTSKPMYFGFTPKEVTIDDKPGLFMANGFMEIMTKEEFEQMMELMKRFYDSEGVEKWIDEQNAMNRWLGHPVLGTTLRDGKYVIPEPRVDRRQFKKNLKRNWGFACEWCNEKVSSKTHTEYFWINESLTRDKQITGQCCSQACGDNLWYDLLIDWICDEKLTNVFHTDKMIKAT